MIHLHCHTEYSFRDSIIRVDDLLNRVEELKMGAVAVTDHGNLAGLLEFYTKAKERGIKPIVGMEIYVVSDVDVKETGENKFHLVLLAKNAVGYQNLIKIASESGRRGFYYVPRADFEMLKKYSEGIIVLTACIYSALYLLSNIKLSVCRIVKALLKIFGKDLFLEVMPHNFREQKKHNLMMLVMSNQYDIPIVVTQDAHYLKPEDKEAHDILMQMQGREPYKIDTLYLSSEDEIFNLLESKHGFFSKKKIQEMIDNTEVIGDMVGDYNIPLSAFGDYPKFEGK